MGKTAPKSERKLGMPHAGLTKLHEALSHCPNKPSSRAVIMVARIKPGFKVAKAELPAARDRQYRYCGGWVREITGGLEVVTWNTGQTGDLQPETANESHAERQFLEFMRKPGEAEWGVFRDFASVDIEISHSPCTACADMLKLFLEKNKGTADPPAKEKFGYKDAKIPAALRWAELYRLSTGPSLNYMQGVGWHMSGRAGQHPDGSRCHLWW
jgi:APOBEC-like N-terminal domain